jgi:prepilin-type N-terminal cleavage/methylation domain-containing protein
MSPRPRAPRGFTLIEVLLSMALVALMLVALNTFVFSMGELWGRNTDVRLFDQHVRAVTRYLQEEMRVASYPPSGAANATPIGVQPVTPANGAQENLITFTLLGGSHLLHWPGRPLPEVVCSLQLRPGQGLILLWHSDLEVRFNQDAPRETLISPWASACSYDYFDADLGRWTNTTALRKDAGGNPQIPQRLRLTFAYGKLTRDALITLPTTPQGLPNPG